MVTRAPRLNIRSDTPLLSKVVATLDLLVWVLFVNSVAALVWDLVAMGVYIFVVTSKVRDLTQSRWVDFLIILFFVIASLAWGVLLSPMVGRLTVGKPIFESLGGLPQRLFFASMKLASAIQYQFNPRDEARLKEFQELDVQFTEAALKESYRVKIYEELPEPRPDFDSAWKAQWEEILEVGVEDTTLRDTFAANHFAFSTIPLHLNSTTGLIAPFIKLFQLILIYALAWYLNGHTQLVTVVQACVGLAFVFSLFWFINHVRNLGEIAFEGVQGMTEALNRQFGDRFKALEGSKARPKKIVLKKRYFSIIRDYLAKTTLLPILILNTALILLLAGVALLIGRIAFPAYFPDLFNWYRRFGLGLTAIACGFVASYYLSFIIIQNIRRIAAPIVAAIVGALLPFAITFVLSGKLEIQQLTTQLSAVLAGGGILLTATLSSIAQKKLSGEE